MACHDARGFCADGLHHVCWTHLVVQLGHLILLLIIGAYALRPAKRPGTVKGNRTLALRMAVRWLMQQAMHDCSNPGWR